MTIVRLAPTSTSVNTGAVTGAASAHAALADSSDSSYVTYEYGEVSVHGFADLSLPSGALPILAQLYAKTKAIGIWSTVRMDTVLSTGSRRADHNVLVSWHVPTEVAAAMFWGVTDSEVDGAGGAISNRTMTGNLVAYELALQVLYYLKPTVTVTAPTGTVDENQVTVTWDPIFDPQATSSPHHFVLKIFTAAQYGAGGFSPGSSSPLFEAGGSTAVSSYTPENMALDDGTYRAYVRVSAGNTPDHWSSWAHSEFTVDAPNPGVPVLSLTAAPLTGSIEIGLDDTAGDIATNLFEVQRSEDAGVSWVNVRTSTGDGRVTNAGTVAVHDFEAPNGREVRYRARAFNAATPSFSQWVEDDVVWSSEDWWLKHATRPSLNLKLRMRTGPADEQVQSNQGVFRPLSSSDPVVVSDVRGPKTGQIVILTESLAEREALEATLELQVPMLLQGPVSSEIPERWVVIGDSGTARIVDKAWAPFHDESLPWTEVARPTGPLEE